MPGKASEETATEEAVSTTTAVSHDHEIDLTLTDRLNKKLLSSLLERMNSGTQFDWFITQNEAVNTSNEDEFSP
jgi:hypothetical protein